MTDRVHSLVVVLDQDIRTDDIQPVISAIEQLRHVISVKGLVANFEANMAVERARREMADKLWNVLKETP